MREMWRNGVEWDSVVCHNRTYRAAVLALTVAAVAAAQSAPDWRRVGGSSVELSLAAPATGPVRDVWFSPTGNVLLARTFSGKIFQTQDFETWAAADPTAEPPRPITASAARLPEPGATVIQAPRNPARTYALGRQLFRSDDAGRTWENLTAYRSNAIIGTGQHSLAISPADPDQLVVANDYGVWRSMDGGMSWNGLNLLLPNLAVRRILATPVGASGTRVAADSLGALELPPGGSVWQAADAAGGSADPEATLRLRFSPVIGAELTAVSQVGRFIYAGGRDGRIWYSIDSGATFRETPMPQGASGPVERLFVDPVEPRVALAALAGRAGRVLRTTQFGNFWDVLDGNLPDAAVHSVTADRASGAIYVATDKGVFFGRADLENSSSPAVNWVDLTARLPEAATAAATDVRLDPSAVQLYIALDGYGVYATAAPHRIGSLRIVNGGDFSARPAAPGSLLSVLGGRVTSADASGRSYPILSGSDTETQIQVPFDAVGPNVSLALRTGAGTVIRDLPVQPVSPAILISRDGAPMLWDADSGLPLDFRNPAHAGGRLQVWATGLGRVNPDWPAGMQAPLDSPPAVIAEVKATLDGNPLQVIRATLVPGYIGFYLVEVQLPAVVNAGTSELFISAAGQESNRVQLNLEP
jgi:uncharacterized protein (TIGR03437 family)